jgi:hypothetical protein
MYDIFYIGPEDNKWKKLKQKFPLAKRAADFQTAQKKSFTVYFWVVWNNLQIADDFNFNYKVSKWDEGYIHVFRNGSFYDGICLFPKKISISDRELDYRFFTNKKEIDIQASTPETFDIFYINTYEEYKDALTTSTTNMFWVVWKDLKINDNFKFDYQVPYYNQSITHVFKNGEYFDGVCLFSKKVPVSNKELDYRFFTNKKEIDVQASTPKPFDVVFISYHEPNADIHYCKLTEKLGRYVYRVNGVKGIHNAHIQAATLVNSDLFWVVDADAILENDFNFEFPQVVHHDTYTKSTVHVWTSRNPINDLQYGNGGVKLLPRKLTLNMDLSKLDMTTSISPSFKSMPAVSNIAAFNTDEFTTWRSAFRECVKLSSKTIQGQINIETEERLNVWCSVGKDRLYGKYAILGALAGREYGQENAGNLPALALINDYDWLKERFEQSHSLMGTHLQ